MRRSTGRPNQYVKLLTELGGVTSIKNLYDYGLETGVIRGDIQSFKTSIYLNVKKGALVRSVSGWIALPGVEIPQEPPPDGGFIGRKAPKARLTVTPPKLTQKSLESRFKAHVGFILQFQISTENQLAHLTSLILETQRECDRLRQRIKELEATA
jgi:hypothetical protein